MEIKMTRDELADLLVKHLPLAPALIVGKRLTGINYGASYEKTVTLEFEDEPKLVAAAPLPALPPSFQDIEDGTPF